MIRTALLQELGDGRLMPEIRNLAAGLGRRGVACRFFLDKHLLRGRVPLSRDTLVAGHIPVVVAALRQMEIDPPVPDDYPACLRPWLHRRVWISTVAELVEQLQTDRGLPVFAKPLGRHKRFTGHVFESFDDLRMLGGTSARTAIACSQVVKWRSEHRVYVVQSRIAGIGHYRGDPAIAPDRQEIEAAVATYTASGRAPAGYGIDFGVLATGQTALIEVNDGYALGNYGLDDDAYTELIVARWCELVADGSDGPHALEGSRV